MKNNDLSFVMREARAVIKLGRPKKALEILEPYLLLSPDNLDLLKMLAECYDLQGEYKKSRPFVMTICSLSNSESEKYNAVLNLAVGLRHEGKHAEALMILDGILKQGLYADIAFAEAALCHQAIGKKEAAEDFMNQSIRFLQKHKLSKGDIFVLSDIAEFYREKEDFDKAIHYIKLILKFDSVDIGALLRLGDIYFNTERYKEAKKYYSKIVDYYPKTIDECYAEEMIARCDEEGGI